MRSSLQNAWLANSRAWQRNSLLQGTGRIARADSILVAKRDRGTAHAKCWAKYSVAVSEKAARAADHSFWDLMELAGSGCGHPFGRNHRLDFTPSIATTRGGSIVGNAAYRRSCAFADGKPPHRRRFFRPAHRETMAGHQARFCASRGRPFQQRISFGRWPSRLPRQQAGGGADLPKAQT